MLEEFRFPALEFQGHLGQGEGGVAPHVAPGLVALEDHPIHPGLEGQAQEPLVGRDVAHRDVLLPKFLGIGRVAGGNDRQGRPEGRHPGELVFQKGIFRQGNEIYGVGPPAHGLRQAAQLSLQGLAVPETQGDGGQSPGFGHGPGEFGTSLIQVMAPWIKG
jgi:hypothetical protein